MLLLFVFIHPFPVLTFHDQQNTAAETTGHPQNVEVQSIHANTWEEHVFITSVTTEKIPESVKFYIRLIYIYIFTLSHHNILVCQVTLAWISSPDNVIRLC